MSDEQCRSVPDAKAVPDTDLPVLPVLPDRPPDRPTA